MTERGRKEEAHQTKSAAPLRFTIRSGRKDPIFFQFFILFVIETITNKEEEGNLLLFCVSVNNIRELISSVGGMWEKELMLLCVNQGKQEVMERGV